MQGNLPLLHINPDFHIRAEVSKDKSCLSISFSSQTSPWFSIDHYVYSTIILLENIKYFERNKGQGPRMVFIVLIHLEVSRLQTNLKTLNYVIGHICLWQSSV